MILERKHVYKIYRDSTYLGTLPYVISEFNYSQDINTGSAETTIEVVQGLDTAHEDVVDIETEAGETLTTELGEVITTERSFEDIGNKDSGRLIASGNDVEIFEYSDDNPNGVLVFSGYISGWSNKVGEEDRTTITVISHGKDLDDYVYGNSAFTLQKSQTNGSDWFPLGRADQISSSMYSVGQSISGEAFSLSKITLYLMAGNRYLGIYPSSVTVTLKLYIGPITGGAAFTPATLLDTVNVIITNNSYQEIGFVLNNEITLSSSSTYYWLLYATDLMEVGTSPTETSSGNYLLINPNVTTYAASTDGADCYFKLYSGAILTDAEFTSTDPSEMITEALTYGGRVTEGDVDLTGLSLTYTFRLATVLEIINKCLELAPSGWYWTVDPATQQLTFKETSASPTHYFTLHKHLESIEVHSTIENIKNVVYFSGGPTAGVNLLKLYTDTASLAINKRGLKRLSDNRVTLAATAQTLSENLMEEYSDEEFSSEITILGETYDIDSIHLGDTVGFRSFGSFIDNLVLQVRSITRGTDYVRLVIGKLPLKSSTYVDDLKRSLENEQTLDNPNTPS